MNLIYIVSIAAAAALAIVLFRMRRAAVCAHNRFAARALAHLESAWSLQSCSVRPAFQDLLPGRALGLLRFRADLCRGGPFRWVNLTDTTMFGCMKMHTLLFIPSPEYNLPMMSIDVIFAGRRRVFVIEVIDPARIEDAYLEQHYRAMLSLKPAAGVMPEAPVTYWYKDILAECSIHARLDAGCDDLMLQTYGAYLDAYAAMAREARPCPEHAAAVRERQRWYVRSLIDNGGPAVDMLAKLMGRARADAYIWSTMFGYDEQGGELSNH